MEELEAFSQEINGMIQSIDEKLKNEFVALEKKCMAPNDVDKFVTCMEKTMTRIENEKKNLEFRMAFLQNSTIECIRRQKENKNALDICKDQTRAAGSNFIDMFLFNIRQ